MAARKKNKEIYSWSGLILIGFFGIHFITQLDLMELAAYLPIGFFVLACFFLLAMPTRCRFPGRKGPCRNRSYGIIFGCMQWHWSMKARAKLGIREQETPPSPARGHRREAGGAGFEAYAHVNEAIPVIIEETRKDLISRRLGLLSACIGLITALPTIATWVVSTARWVISLLG